MRTILALVALSAFCWPGVALADGGDDCEEHPDCARYGRCETHDEGPGDKTFCGVPADGCAAVGTCTYSGLCVPGMHPVDKRPICQADAASCAASGSCRWSGRCVAGVRAGASACVVETAAQCEASPACARFGRCALGRHAETGESRCEVTEASCATSGACKVDGACGWNEALKMCVAVSDAACRAATGCKSRGDCARIDRRCAPGKAADCSRSIACKQSGACEYDPDASYCALSDEGCAGTAACKRYGHCKVVAGRDDSWCGGQDDDDCANTVSCKLYGACHSGDSWTQVSHCLVHAEDSDRDRGEPLAIARVAVPSTQAPFKEYRFDATNLFDGKADTSWQPRAAKRGGAGVVLEVELKAAAQVCEVAVKNGFQRTDALGDLFSANSRIEFARVSAGPDARELLTFAAGEKDGSARLPPAAATKTVTIEVLSVHPGARWKDLAISEIQVFGCKPPAAP